MIVPDRLDRAARPARAAPDRRPRPDRGRPPRRAARRRRRRARRSTTRCPTRTSGSPASCTSGSRRSWPSSRTCASRSPTIGFRRIVFLNGHYDNTYAIAYACANAADRLPAGARAFPINYWDGMTADEAAEFFDPANGLHANKGETSAVLAINPDLVDMDAANAEMPPFPEVTNAAAGPHRVLLLGAGLGLPRDAVRHLGRRRASRRPSSASATSRSSPTATVRLLDDIERTYAGDAGPLSGGASSAAPLSAQPAHRLRSPAPAAEATLGMLRSSSNSGGAPAAAEPVNCLCGPVWPLPERWLGIRCGCSTPIEASAESAVARPRTRVREAVGLFSSVRAGGGCSAGSGGCRWSGGSAGASRRLTAAASAASACCAGPSRR